MRGFFLGLLLGLAIAVGFWYFVAGRGRPTLRQAQRQAQTAVEKTHKAASEAADELKAKLEALDLTPEKIQKELAETGKVIRRKASGFGQSLADKASDARITADIKAKYANDPDLSIWDISVSTADGRVTLAGTVSSPRLIGKAVLLALETNGARSVISTLQVRKES
jgi:hyperosmotically inducible protein